MMEVPPEMYDAIVFHVQNPQYHDSRYVARSTEIYDKEAIKRLSILRLVNQGFCRSASIRLFRTIHANFSANSLQRYPNHWAPKRLFELSKSRYCLDVREVVVNINGDGFLGSDPGSSEFRQFIEDLAALLPACLCDFRRLSSLSICGFSIGYSGSTNRSCPEDHRIQFTDIIANIFRYVPFVGLEELQLSLPLTHDFATLLAESKSTPSRSSIRPAMRSVKHLNLTVCDSSGFGGQRYYQNPPSSAQAAFPNSKYASKFFELVGFAAGLESLRISCTHVLDMDVLDLKNLDHLQSLELCRIKISTSRFLSMAERNRGSLRVIYLWTVQLKSGTWTDVLLGLCHLPHLENFHIDSAGYTTDGESSNWAPGLLPPIDDPQAIESTHLPDTFALGNLERHVIANRRRRQLPEFGEFDYRHTKMEPVEDILSWFHR